MLRSHFRIYFQQYLFDPAQEVHLQRFVLSGHQRRLVQARTEAGGALYRGTEPSVLLGPELLRAFLTDVESVHKALGVELGVATGVLVRVLVQILVRGWVVVRDG